MVCLDPARESDVRKKRWCWGEVIRQLLYRYDFLF
jgi:breast cancer 2 susceptibility protein